MFKLIENLDNYFILSCTEKEAIIGTKLLVPLIPKSVNIFQLNSTQVDREFHVFFLIVATEKNSKINNDFIKNGLHILYLNEDEEFPQTAEEFREILNDFIKKTF